MKRKIISVIMLSALVLSGCKNTVIQDSAQGSETDNYSIFTQPATPDEVTIEIVNATECSNEVYWDNYQAIRAFKYTMAFIPKDRKGMYLLVPIENLPNVTTFLEENGISIDVIR